MAAYVPCPPAPTGTDGERGERTGYDGRTGAPVQSPSHYPRLADYPLSGYYLNPSPYYPYYGATERPGRRGAFRVPRMYAGGYRGFSYRGGLW